jgi:hypothetical protein
MDAVVRCAPVMRLLSTRAPWVSALALCALLALDGSAAHAQSTDAQAPAPDDTIARAEAKIQFQAGVAAYDAQRYPEALAHFQEAYRIKPHPLVRVNMANCYERLGKPLQAIFHFERFLDENGGSPEQRKEVTEALRALRAKVGEVALRIAPDGATVTIDGGEKRQTPILEPIRLDAGLHVIEVALSGYESVKREVVLNGGQRIEVTITLERALTAATAAPALVAAGAATAEPAAAPADTAQAAAPSEPAEAPPPAEPPVPDDEESRTLLPVAGWITGGATAALLVAALITGQLALSAEADFEDAAETVADTSGATPIERRAAHGEALAAASNADSLAVTSDILLGVAVLGAAATVYLAIDHHAGDDGDERASTALLIAPGRIAVHGKF